MSESAVNHKKSYVDHLKGRSKCLIHGPGHSSDECKLLGDFSSKYSKSRSTKYRVHDPATRKKFNRHQKNNTIVNHVVD